MSYINCGDWIENNSFIVYNEDEFVLKYYSDLFSN